jgi:hypothetical protein
MTSWLTKLRISAALDADSKQPASLRRKISASAQLRGFEADLTALDRTLRQNPPRPQAPPGLHRLIMQAVRAAEGSAAAPRGLAILRWVAAPAVAMLAMAVVWLALRSPARPPAQGSQSLDAAATALEMGGQLPQTVPAAVVAPLSGELEKLNRDLDNTAQFLLASLP